MTTGAFVLVASILCFVRMARLDDIGNRGSNRLAWGHKIITLPRCLVASPRQVYPQAFAVDLARSHRD